MSLNAAYVSLQALRVMQRVLCCSRSKWVKQLLTLLSVLYLRHILAILHFNENLMRQPQCTKDGRTYYRVTYPKYKLGEEVVKHVPSPPTYSK